MTRKNTHIGEKNFCRRNKSTQLMEHTWIVLVTIEVTIELSRVSIPFPPTRKVRGICCLCKRTTTRKVPVHFIPSWNLIVRSSSFVRLKSARRPDPITIRSFHFPNDNDEEDNGNLVLSAGITLAVAEPPLWYVGKLAWPPPRELLASFTCTSSWWYSYS